MIPTKRKEVITMCYVVTYFFTTPATRNIQTVTLYGIDLDDVSTLFWTLYPTATLTAVDDPQLWNPEEEEDLD